MAVESSVAVPQFINFPTGHGNAAVSFAGALFDANGDKKLDQGDFEALTVAAAKNGIKDLPPYNSQLSIVDNMKALGEVMAKQIHDPKDPSKLIDPANDSGPMEAILKSAATAAAPAPTPAPAPGTAPSAHPDFLPPAEVRAIRQVAAGLSEDEIKALQAKLHEAGFDLGKFGPNHDGIDGKVGKYTATALVKYLIKMKAPGFEGLTEEAGAKLLAEKSATDLRSWLQLPAQAPAPAAGAAAPDAPVPAPDTAPPSDNAPAAASVNVGAMAVTEETVTYLADPDRLKKSGLDTDKDGKFTPKDLDADGNGTLNKADFDALLKNSGVDAAKLNLAFDESRPGESVGNLVNAIVKQQQTPPNR